MKKFFHPCGVLLVGFLVMGCTRQDEKNTTVQIGADPQVFNDQVVDIACGQCQFGMQGGGCDLAIRFDGKSYFVNGSHIDDFGDAHADDGMCNSVRQARVTGTINDDILQVRKITLLNAATKEE